MNIQEVFIGIEQSKESHKRTTEILKTMITHMRFIEEKVDRLYIKIIKEEFLSLVRGQLNMNIKSIKDAYELSKTDVEIEKKLLKLAQDHSFHPNAYKEWEILDECNITNIELFKKYLSSNSSEITCIKNALKLFLSLYEFQ